MILQLIVNGLITGGLVSLLALSFALIYNTTRIFHVAHGAVYTFAAYVCYCFTSRWHLELGWSICISLAATIALGLGIEAVVYVPLARQRAPLSIYLLSSLGVYIVVINLLALLFGNDPQVLNSGPEASLRFGNIVVSHIQVVQAIASPVLIIAVLAFLRYSHYGRIIRAIRDNPTLIEVIGIDLRAMRFGVFAMASGLAGVAAILSSLDVGVVPDAGLPMLLVSAVALIVGGIGVYEGPVVGGLLVGTLQGLLIFWISSRWIDTATYATLILFLLFRPQGIVGVRRRLEEAVA